jgi:hypothetical protein
MGVYERIMARPAKARISVGDYWPAAVIAVGLVASAVWIGIIGWVLEAILVLLL